VAELAARLGRSPGAVAEALQACEGRTVRSLDSPVFERDDEPVMLADTIGGEDPGYAQAEAGATIDRLTPILDERAREILRLRFHEDLRQADIAERVGCSQMHVSRTIRASLKRLEAYASAERAA
jgi:RNA polymerase sigma-B factor